MAPAGRRRRARITAEDLAQYGSVAGGTVNVERAARGLGVSTREVRQAIRQAEAAQSNMFYRRMSRPRRRRRRRGRERAGHVAGRIRAGPTRWGGQRAGRRAGSRCVARHGSSLGGWNSATVAGSPQSAAVSGAARGHHQTRTSSRHRGFPGQRTRSSSAAHRRQAAGQWHPRSARLPPRPRSSRRYEPRRRRSHAEGI